MTSCSPFFAATLLTLPLYAATALAQEVPEPPAGIADKVATCATCHGADGRPLIAEAAIIWGQEYFYLYTQLRDYQAGRRSSEIMEPVVADLDREQLKAIAEYFAALPWPAVEYRSSEEDEAGGRRAANAGQCPQCHLATYAGDSRIPRLAGQTVAYLEKTMLDFKHDRRRNAPDIAALLRSFTEEEIRAMAAYLAGL